MGAIGKLRAVSLGQPGQTYFSILTASTAIAVCVDEAHTHVSGCSASRWSPPTKGRKVEG